MSLTTTLALTHGLSAIEGSGTTVSPVRAGQVGATFIVSTINTGFEGPPGPQAPVSSDPSNRLTSGSDEGLYVPELAADPLAYYILSKS